MRYIGLIIENNRQNNTTDVVVSNKNEKISSKSFIIKRLVDYLVTTLFDWNELENDTEGSSLTNFATYKLDKYNQYKYDAHDTQFILKIIEIED